MTIPRGPAAAQAVAKLENELLVVERLNEETRSEYAELVKSGARCGRQMKTTQENMSRSEKERDTIEAQVLHAQQDRDAHFKEVHRLTDALNQADNEKDQLQQTTDNPGRRFGKSQGGPPLVRHQPEHPISEDKTPPRGRWRRS